MFGATALVAIFAGGSAAQDAGLSSHEVRQLDRGHLVTRPRSYGEGRVGGTSFVVVQRPQSEVWDAVNSLGRYQHFLPNTSSVRVVARQPGLSLVRLEHSLGIVSAQYYLRVTSHLPDHQINFELDRSRPHDIASARGYLQVRPRAGQSDQSVLVWGVYVNAGGVVGSLVASDLQHALLHVPQNMSNYIERH